MKNKTFTEFSYNTPVKQSSLISHDDNYIQSNKQYINEKEINNNNNNNNQNSPNINFTSSSSKKQNENMTDSKLNRIDEQYKKHQQRINYGQDYHDSQQQDSSIRMINTSQTQFNNNQSKKIYSNQQTRMNNQNNNNNIDHYNYTSDDVPIMCKLEQDTPFKNRNHNKTSSQLPIQCLPNIFYDQTQESNIIKQQQQQQQQLQQSNNNQQQQNIFDGLVVDGKFHPIKHSNINKTNGLDSSRVKQHQSSLNQSNVGYINNINSININNNDKNQMRVRSQQHSDNRLNFDEYNININHNNIHINNNTNNNINRSLVNNNYRIDRLTKNNEQKSNNNNNNSNVKKAIRVSLQRNPALAASLDIYTNGGNAQSIQQISKVVQPYLINQFLQKRKNLLQRKPNNVHHSTGLRKNNNNSSIHGRQLSLNKNQNNDSVNIISNNNNNLQNKRLQQISHSQNHSVVNYSNNNNNKNQQNNNLSFNNKGSNIKPTNLNALINEYRSGSGGQRLLLQDFYIQQGIKDPDFTNKQDNLIDQYNYSNLNLIELQNKQNDIHENKKNQESKQDTETTKQSIQVIDDSNKNNNNHNEQQQNQKYQKSNSALIPQYENNDNIDQTYHTNFSQTISPNHHQQLKSQLQQDHINNQFNQDQDINNECDQQEQQNVQEEQNNIKNAQFTAMPSIKTLGESPNIKCISNSLSPNSKVSSKINKTNNNNNTNNPNNNTNNPNNNNSITSIFMDEKQFQQYIMNKNNDESISPGKYTNKSDKNQLIVHQRQVLQQNKRKGNSFNYNRGGTFSIGNGGNGNVSGDPSFDLSIININNNNNTNNIQNKFDFYDSKSIFQQNMFSPPKIHKSKQIYSHSNTMNQSDINKQQQNTQIILDSKKDSNDEQYNFLNEEQSISSPGNNNNNNDKRSHSIPRNFINNIQTDQILLIKSHHINEPIQQQSQQPNSIIDKSINNNQKQLQTQDQFYTCYFMRGNNSGLVKRVLLTRSNWKESPVYSCNLNFRWHPFSKGIKFENLSLHKKRIVNHFEFHSEITTKNGIIKNIGRYCRERDLNVFDFTPCTFLFSLKDKFWDLDLVRFCDFFYRNLPDPLKCLSEYKKNVIEIRSKFRAVTIRNNQKQTKKKQRLSTPPYTDKYGELRIHSTFLDDNQSSYLWLLKPTNLNRGRGIELFSNLNQLETLLNNYFDGFYEQPIANKAQENTEKQISQLGQETLLNIAMTSSEAQNVQNINNKEQNEQKEQLVPLHNLLNKSLYQNPFPLEKLEEKAKPNPINNEQNDKLNDNTNNIENNKNEDKDQNNNQQQLQQEVPKDIENNNNPQQQQNNNNPENENDQQKVKKQKIKKNKASTSNSNVSHNNNQNINNNNIHMARVRELSIPKKIINQQSKQQQNQPNSPDKKNNKNSIGISAEFGGYLMKEHSFVIQKYIEKPFLINDRKFDIRMWVVVNQNMDVYLFKEGYIRTSSDKYDIDDQENIFVHLTNNAIQKYSNNYGQYENGNQLSLDNFDQYLKIKGYKQTFRNDVMPRIQEIITISMLSVKNKLNANDRKYSFEVFGYDFFIDQQFNVWLIEINTNPCIEESSPLLEMLIPRMIDDALKLTVDLIFPPQYSDEIIQKQIQKYKLNKDKENNNDNDDGTVKNKQQSNQDNNTFNNGSSIANGFYGTNHFQNKKILIESLFPVDGYSNQENMFQFLVNLAKSN